MSEPTTRAKKIVKLTSEIMHWTIQDDRIQWRSDAYAIREHDRTVLIDPLPLEDDLLDDLGQVAAICLTGACHQRASWRYRERFGVKVWAPRGAATLEEPADFWYWHGDDLPGGLKAIHAPGPTEATCILHRSKGPGALFCADIVINDGKAVMFVPDKYMDEPQRTRESARRILDLRFGLLCFDHGPPLIADPHAAIRAALESNLTGPS
jgi:glyoxylase-like metal-dependent hydrolase (beta-lactamase superfamily II)